MMVFVRLWTTAEIEIVSRNPPMASIDITHRGASARTTKALGITLRLKASVNEPKNFVKFLFALPICKQRGSSGGTSATYSTSTGCLTSRFGKTKRGIQSGNRQPMSRANKCSTQPWVALTAGCRYQYGQGLNFDRRRGAG